MFGTINRYLGGEHFVREVAGESLGSRRGIELENPPALAGGLFCRGIVN